MLSRLSLIISLALALPSVCAQSVPDGREPPRATTSSVDLKTLHHDGWSYAELARAAEQGDREAAMELGKFWFMQNVPGQRVTAETLEARHWTQYWLAKAAQDGHPAPLLYLEILKLPEGFLESEDKASGLVRQLIAQCRTRAKEGDLECIECLCLFLTPPPDQVLSKWFDPIRAQAEGGDIDAKAMLGHAFIFGHATCEGFLNEGLGHAKDAADAGNINGMKTYGQALALDLCNTGEVDKGMEWLDRAADAGHIDAMNVLLMTMHNEADLPPQELARLKRREAHLTKTMCERGELSMLVSEGSRLVESGESPQQGLRLLDEAAEIGSLTALDTLARYYQDNGHYVPANLEKAVAYAKRLSDQGHASGMLRLGRYYERGQGVPKDGNRAFALVTRARDLGLIDAYVEQARMILKGVGTQSNPQEAFNILKELSDDISPPKEIYFLLGYMHEGGLGTPQDYTAAYEQYTRGAEAGDDKAMNNLASMCEAGLGARKSTDLALKWYGEASKLGNEDAAANLERLKQASGRTSR